MAITGRTVTYISPTESEFAEALAKAGVPPRVAAIAAGFALAQAQGDLDLVSNDLASLLRRNPASMKEYLGHYYGERLVRTDLNFDHFLFHSG